MTVMIHVLIYLYHFRYLSQVTFVPFVAAAVYTAPKRSQESNASYHIIHNLAQNPILNPPKFSLLKTASGSYTSLICSSRSWFSFGYVTKTF